MSRPKRDPLRIKVEGAALRSRRQGAIGWLVTSVLAAGAATLGMLEVMESTGFARTLGPEEWMLAFWLVVTAVAIAGTLVCGGHGLFADRE